jgi:hypothetical protein
LLQNTCFSLKIPTFHMKPIHKFNNGNGAMLCNVCRTIISVGKPTNVLLCDKCHNERIKTDQEFKAIIKKK